MSSKIHAKINQSRFAKNENILLITLEALKEIYQPTFGGSRLISELKKEFEKENKVSIISMHEIYSISSKFLKIEKNKYQKIKKRLGNEKIRWAFSLLISLFAEFLTRLDFVFSFQIRKKIERIKPNLVIYNGSIGASAVLKICKKLDIPLVLCEHNIDYYFLGEKLNSRFFSPFIFLYKIVELSIVRKTHLVLCFNENDKKKLLQEQIPPFKIMMWQFQIKPRTYDGKRMRNLLPSKIRIKIRKKPIICFLGAGYTVNIIAVRQILEIAQRVPEAIFLIVGSVGERFKETRESISNVVFTGYVDDIKPYLATADVFLNLKLTSDTGIEAKVFDYLEFNKPIISTRMGASGFENCKNVIVVSTLDEAIIKIRELTAQCQRIFK